MVYDTLCMPIPQICGMKYPTCSVLRHSLAKCVGPGAVLLAPGPRAPEVRGEGAGLWPKNDRKGK